MILATRSSDPGLSLPKRRDRRVSFVATARQAIICFLERERLLLQPRAVQLACTPVQSFTNPNTSCIFCGPRSVLLRSIHEIPVHGHRNTTLARYVLGMLRYWSMTFSEAAFAAIRNGLPAHVPSVAECYWYGVWYSA